MMTPGSASATDNQATAVLKAGTFILPTLCMTGLDPETIDGLLYERVAKAPNFFRNTPVVLDISNIHNTKPKRDLAIAVGAIRGYGLIPIGVRGGTDELRDQARLMELAVFPRSRKENQTSAQNRTTSQKPTIKPKLATTKIVDGPVRSGQRVYAQGGDLVLLAPVSSGAEVVADGNVHAYAPIRGRVLAGVLGDEGACIFCKDLSAELVSIAGRYKVSEDLESRYMGRLIAVSLRGDSLIFKKL
jgi:septum site-determining protein MinC